MTLGEPWLDEMRVVFVARLGDERAAFLAAHKAQDWPAIMHRAHKLAGLAGMLGAPEVGEAALQLEERMNGDQPFGGEFAALIAAIEAEQRRG